MSKLFCTRAQNDCTGLGVIVGSLANLCSSSARSFANSALSPKVASNGVAGKLPSFSDSASVELAPSLNIPLIELKVGESLPPPGEGGSSIVDGCRYCTALKEKELKVDWKFGTPEERMGEGAAEEPPPLIPELTDRCRRSLFVRQAGTEGDPPDAERWVLPFEELLVRAAAGTWSWCSGSESVTFTGGRCPAMLFEASRRIAE